MANKVDVTYLTGAPAAGKSSLAERLEQFLSPIEVFNYGQKLTEYLAGKSRNPLAQDELRKQSSKVITPEDVEALDSILLQCVAEQRLKTNFVIDTHAVTKESYGFRVTPFSLQRFGELRPTKIVVLYTSPAVALSRIGADPGGRPMITEFESGFHSGLQASVALSYGTSLGYRSISSTATKMHPNCSTGSGVISVARVEARAAKISRASFGYFCFESDTATVSKIQCEREAQERSLHARTHRFTRGHECDF